MMKIDYTFHSHTFRCGHATGDISDYVPLAIKNGYKIYGVSDHVFLPGVHQPNTRGDYSLLDEYIDEFKKVKEQYKNEIEMYLGFECEYCDHYHNYYLSLLKEKGFDYLICGQHMRFDENGFKSGYFGKDIPLEWSLDTYKKDIEGAMKSGLFLYIAHPDFFFSATSEVTELHKKMTKEVIDMAIKYDAVLEINIHGFGRNHYYWGTYTIDYPCLYFWQEVAKTNIKVVCGGDFHNPNEIGDEELLKQYEDLLKQTGVKLTDIREIYKNYKNKLKSLL